MTRFLNVKMNAQTIAEKVLPIFEAHKAEGDVEVEIRLGKHNGALFDTNVGKDTWKRVLSGLRSIRGGKVSRVAPLTYTTATATTFASPLMRNLVSRR